MDKGTRQKKVVQGLFKTKMSELFKYLNFNFFWAQAKLIFSQDGELYLGTLSYFFVWVGGMDKGTRQKKVVQGLF